MLNKFSTNGHSRTAGRVSRGFDAVAFAPQDLDGGVPAILLHEQVVGVEGGHHEDGDAGIGERDEQRGQYADEREVEGAGDPEAPPAPFAADTVGDGLLRNDDRQLVGGAGDREERAGRCIGGPGGQGGVGGQPADGEEAVEWDERRNDLIRIVRYLTP